MQLDRDRGPAGAGPKPLVLSPGSRGPLDAALHAVGSMWIAAVLLVLLLVAMAFATVFETMRGTERTLAEFYRSWWFEALLGLLSINLLAAVAARFPLRMRHLGFAVTHVSIVVTVAGALITSRFGVDGQVGLREGESASEFSVSADSLTVRSASSGAMTTADLDSRDFGGFSVVESPRAPAVELEGLRLEVTRYLPDSDVRDEVVDDAPHLHRAVEVSLTGSASPLSAWIFEGSTIRIGRRTATFRWVADPDELARLLEPERQETPSGEVRVKVTYKEKSFDLLLEDCLEKTVALGDTGYSLRVLRYLPHASVGEDRNLRSLSDQPVNPAIEAQLEGPAGTERKLAFARFPDFGTAHGEVAGESPKLRLEAPMASSAQVEVEIIGSPNRPFHARLSAPGGAAVVRELAPGAAVDTPWPGSSLTFLRSLERARVRQSYVPVEPRANARAPALLLRLSASGEEREVWVRKFQSARATLGGRTYDLAYGNKVVPLGFTVRLNRFEVGYYPGGSRPRSFTSNITFVDPAAGGNRDAIISMNRPAAHGGFSFFQSSYRMDGGEKMSFLSVSRDPGMAIAFAGYIGIMLGMCIVIATRMADRRKASRIGNVPVVSLGGAGGRPGGGPGGKGLVPE